MTEYYKQQLKYALLVQETSVSQWLRHHKATVKLNNTRYDMAFITHFNIT